MDLAITAGNDILKKCVEFGGSVTGEHSIGVEVVTYILRMARDAPGLCYFFR